MELYIIGDTELLFLLNYFKMKTCITINQSAENAITV